MLNIFLYMFLKYKLFKCTSVLILVAQFNVEIKEHTSNRICTIIFCGKVDLSFRHTHVYIEL